MGKHIEYRTTHAGYSYLKPQPNVVYCEDSNHLHYNPIDYKRQCFQTTALDSGTITFNIGTNINTDSLYCMYYSRDGGKTWTTVDNQDNKAQRLTITLNVVAGNSILWMGDGQNLAEYDNDSMMYYGCCFTSTAHFNVDGNIFSLVHFDDFSSDYDIDYNGQFARLFYDFVGHNNTLIVDATNLCLPANVLMPNCYESMFDSCTTLVNPPSIIYGMQMANNCCASMFYQCTSMKTAPKLPSTFLAEACYASMFEECSSLIEAPELPATTLATDCYYYMFGLCSSLTKAPVLPATILTTNCYNNMFQDCSNLNYVKAMFISSPTANASTWLANVSPNGTFVKSMAATWNVNGTSGIPDGWNVETN